MPFPPVLPRDTLGAVANLSRCPHCGKPLRYMSAQEAATELGKSRQTIHTWMQEGRFAGVIKEKVPGGTRYLIPIREVQRMKRSRPN